MLAPTPWRVILQSSKTGTFCSRAGGTHWPLARRSPSGDRATRIAINQKAPRRGCQNECFVRQGIGTRHRYYQVVTETARPNSRASRTIFAKPETDKTAGSFVRRHGCVYP